MLGCGASKKIDHPLGDTAPRLDDHPAERPPNGLLYYCIGPQVGFEQLALRVMRRWLRPDRSMV